MSVAAPSVVLSAGTISWRMEHGKVRVMLIQQAGRSDLSFPKGKVERGESLPEAAVRETFEETGVAVSLGTPLGASEYTLPGGRDKVVHYWAAEATDSAIARARFAANDEITAAVWLSVKSARQKLAFEPDRAILDTFLALAERDALNTFAVIALRHGKAVPAGSWTGPDSTRPLDQLGRHQARSSARAIAAFSPRKLMSSTAARCMSTIEPVATLTGRDVKATVGISQDAWEDGESDLARVIEKRLAKRASAVLCSHGPVLPGILEELAAQTGSSRRRLRREAGLDVGDFVVVHLAVTDPTSGLVAVESHSPVLA